MLIIDFFFLDQDDPLVPLHLLIFAIQTFLTTFTCLLDMWSWSDRSHEEKVNLSWLYFPYLAFGKFLLLLLSFFFSLFLSTCNVVGC